MTGHYLLIAYAPSREGLEYGPAKPPDHRFGFFYQDERTGVGSYCDAKQALARMAEITRLGAGWFLPLLRRMAKGKEVPLEEILRELAAHAHGPPIWDLGPKIDHRELLPDEVVERYTAREQ
ncbi:hypothetical protein [Paraliomyxa miuraensis]|uniref:hypothetical protein n=1 Tax=Paraliomyxa miuraensis TaxID=376150 RepID=UPI00224FE469|nr:hypothetical protein [Paraliomyxa miuraensis]MCX4247185.1 hypothetical protein [Paraliomyxa miuraensis]